MSKIYLLKITVVLCLLIQPNISFALYRTGPGPGLFDYLDQTDLILVGKAEKIKTIEFSGFFSGFDYYYPMEHVVTKVVLVKFDEAYVLSAEGKTQIHRPVYLYTFQGTIVHFAKRGMYLLSKNNSYPRIEYSFSIDANGSVGFTSEWDGNGVIHGIRNSGHLVFNPKNDKNPISYDEFELTIENYLQKKYKEPAIVNPLLFSPQLALEKFEEVKNKWLTVFRELEKCCP